MFLATIPAVLYVDKWGRKPTLIIGAICMGICHFIVGAIIATSEDNWEAHKVAGWVAVVFIWIFAICQYPIFLDST
jgi:MFS family permease